MTERVPGAGHEPRFGDVLTAHAASVTLVTLADGRDDIGTTVSSFCPVSSRPPLVAVGLQADSYPAEVLARLDWFAVTLLEAGQRALAGRFTVAGLAGCPAAARRRPAPPRIACGRADPRRRAGRAGMRGDGADHGW